MKDGWKFGSVDRAIEYCKCCQQQIRCGLVRFDDGTFDTLHVGRMHRDGSFTGDFTVGTRVAQMIKTGGYSLARIIQPEGE